MPKKGGINLRLTMLKYITVGARGFSCAVSGFGPEHVSACGRRNEAPRRTREKTSGTQGNSVYAINENTSRCLLTALVSLVGSGVGFDLCNFCQCLMKSCATF